MDRPGIDLRELGSLMTTRFRVFLLACHHLQIRWDKLEAAGVNGGVLDESRCLLLFEEALQSFLAGCTERDPIEAAEELREKLAGAFSRSERKRNPEAAAIFAEIAQVVIDTIRDHPPESHLQRIHDDARDVARRFFAASPHQETQDRLIRSCQIHVYNESDKTSRHDLMSHTQHHNGDENPTNAGTIRLPFNETKTYESYLQYPFLFIHEYTAHVFAIDHGSRNKNFNDGWMIFAANAFFIEEESKSGGRYPFHSDQLHAFSSDLAAIVHRKTKRAIANTTSLYKWLTDDHPGWFERITFDLAAFRPNEGDNVTWPREVLSQLFHSYQHDRVRLGDRLTVVRTARELMHGLSPVVFSDTP